MERMEQKEIVFLSSSFRKSNFVSTVVAIQLVIVFNVLLRFCARVVRNTSSNSTRNEVLGSSAIYYV